MLNPGIPKAHGFNNGAHINNGKRGVAHVKKALITGMAGFIGFHLANRLLHAFPGIQLLGLDNINCYYDPALKYARLNELGFSDENVREHKIVTSEKNDGCRFVKADLRDKDYLLKLFESEGFDYVINLAAQAGVRYSLIHPEEYIASNVTGFLNLLECCRAYPIGHLLYASSSSVYGLNTKTPFSEEDITEKPASLYACSKKMNESMAFTYAHLFGIKSSGLRFFTVYGEWGRPDMAYYGFTKKILNGEPIQLYNHGDMSRDFTYVKDIVTGICDLLEKAPDDQEIPCETYNIGNNSPVKLGDFVSAIETALGKEAEKVYLPMQPGDVPKTYADVDKMMRKTNFKPDTRLEDGIKLFVDWYRQYYKL